MKIQNLQTDALETMTTKDALFFTSSILKHIKADKIFTNNFIEYTDKTNDKMLIIELTLQAFKEDKTETRYKATFLRAKNLSCMNGITYEELSKEDFKAELVFQKRFNSITK